MGRYYEKEKGSFIVRGTERAILFAQGCIVLEDGRMVDEGGHLLMGAIGGGAVGSRGGAIGGRGGLVVVHSLGLGMVDAGLRLVHVRSSGHMVNRGVMHRGVAIAGGGVGVSLLPRVEGDLGDGDGVTRHQGVAEIMSE